MINIHKFSYNFDQLNNIKKYKKNVLNNKKKYLNELDNYQLNNQ